MMAPVRTVVVGMERGIYLENTEKRNLAGFDHGLDVHGEGVGNQKCDTQVSCLVSEATRGHKIPGQGVIWNLGKGGQWGRCPWRVSCIMGSGVLEEDLQWMKRFGSCQRPCH